VRTFQQWRKELGRKILGEVVASLLLGYRSNHKGSCDIRMEDLHEHQSMPKQHLYQTSLKALS
jgi:hypothetical protein